MPEIEPSRSTGFAGNTLDRRSENRSEAMVAEAFGREDARYLAFAAGRTFVTVTGEALDPFTSRAKLDEMQPIDAAAVLLGFDLDRPIIAVPVKHDTDNPPDGMKAIDLRSLAFQGGLPPAQLGMVAQGASLLAWNKSNRYCGRCGGKNTSADGGYKRVCSQCAAEHFPRTDPVVIMLAIDGENCLMGRGAHFPEGMYSALAGFVEPGETIEAAVRRETGEEAGIEIGRVKYHASQPWPFPHTLMIGCYGEAQTNTIVMEGDELADCRWFSRSEILLALKGEQTVGFFVPPAMSIAHHLLRHWAEGVGG